MLSRVANSLYWMSRNVERAENNARILDVQLLQMIEASDEELVRDSDWKLIYEICASSEELSHIKSMEHYEEDQLVQYLSFDEGNMNSVANCVRTARENARVSRDHITDDYWQTWNRCYLALQDVEAGQCTAKDVGK